jgi:hypothetical protein
MGRRGEAEMKVNIEVVDGLAEDEVLIRCGRADEKIRKATLFTPTPPTTLTS